MKHKQTRVCLLLLLSLTTPIFAAEDQAYSPPQSIDDIIRTVDSRKIKGESNIKATQYSRVPIMLTATAASCSLAAWFLLADDEQVCHQDEQYWHELKDSTFESIHYLGSSFSAIGQNYFLSNVLTAALVGISTNLWTPLKNYTIRTLQGRAAVTVEEKKQITRIKNLLDKLEKYNKKPDDTPYKEYFKVGLDLLTEKQSQLQDQGIFIESLLYKTLFQESKALIVLLESAYSIVCTKSTPLSKELIKKRFKEIEDIANYNRKQKRFLAQLCAKAIDLSNNNRDIPKSSSALYLQGDPGTGKTSYVKALAYVTGLPLVKINCSEVEIWRQSLTTRESTRQVLESGGALDALSKNFKEAATEFGTPHPIRIILLDEVDKVLADLSHPEAPAVIREWTDPTASQSIKLPSLGLNLPISNCIVILAGNIPLDKLVSQSGLGELKSRLHPVTFERSTTEQREQAIHEALNEHWADDSCREQMLQAITRRIEKNPQLAGTRAIKGIVERCCYGKKAEQLGLIEEEEDDNLMEDTPQAHLLAAEAPRDKDQAPHQANEEVMSRQLAIYGQIARIFAKELGPEIARGLLQASKDRDETPGSP